MSLNSFHASELLGAIIDERFEILEKLGEGGMGAIYKARQISMDRVVALKILLHDQRGDPISAERFRHEAYLASRLKHPNTIVIHDFGQTEDGLLYIAMEFLSGESLKERLEQGPLSYSIAIKIITQTLQTISEAHQMGLVHRDLKPGNIFLTRLNGDDDFVKVLDFGIAKLTTIQDGLDSNSKPLANNGRIHGTPTYMSPEQIRGKAIDLQSDIYSIGVLFYEMLTGRPPYYGNSAVDIMMAHLKETPTSLREFRDDIPIELERTVMRALEKDRRVRYQDANEFLETIENYKFNSGFYAVPAQLATISKPTIVQEDLEMNIKTDDDNSGETMTISPSTFAPVPELSSDIFSGDSSSISLDNTDFDDMMLEDEHTLMEFDDPEENTLFEEEKEEFDDFTEVIPRFSDVELGIEPPEHASSSLLEIPEFDEEPPIKLESFNIPASAFGSKTAASKEVLPPEEETIQQLEPSMGLQIPSFPEAEQLNSLEPLPDLAPPTFPSAQVEAVARKPPNLQAVKPSLTSPNPQVEAVAQPRSPFPNAQVAEPVPPRITSLPAASPTPSPRVQSALSSPPKFEALEPSLPKALQPRVPFPVGNSLSGIRKPKKSYRRLFSIILALLVTGAGATAVVLLDPFAQPAVQIPSGPPKAKIQSELPNLEIFNQNNFVGETPIDFELPDPNQALDLKIYWKKRVYTAVLPPLSSSRWLYIFKPAKDQKQLAWTLIKSEPSGAHVRWNDLELGLTPLNLLGEAGESLELEISIEGGASRVLSSELKLEGGIQEITLQ